MRVRLASNLKNADSAFRPSCASGQSRGLTAHTGVRKTPVRPRRHSLSSILKCNLIWYVYHPGQTSNCKYTRENRAAHTTRPLSPVSARLRTAPFRYMYTDPPDTHTHAHALLSRSLRPKGPHDYPNTPPCTLRPALGATSINDVVADSVAISHLGHSLTTGDAEMPASCHVWPTRSCAGG